MPRVYPPAFLDHFERPRGVGRLDDATHRGEAEDAACGDRLGLDLRVREGRVEAAAFHVEGCAGAIAAGSALVTLLPGRAAAVGAVTREEIDARLGGVPAAKRHALSLALRALEAALAAPVA